MAPLRIYTADLSFYDEYMEMLVAEARAGSSHAVARMASFVPRLEGVPANEIPAAELTMDDARCVYAREHGFTAWEEFSLALQQIADGSREELFVDFIHAVETGDTETVERHLDRDPDLVHHVGSTHKSALHSAANEELASLLISRGAPVDMECPLPGGTPLIHALLWGWAQTAEVIAAMSLSPGNLRVAAGLGRPDLLRKMWLEDGSLAPEARAGRAYYRPNYGWFPWEPGDGEQEVLDEALIYAATNGRLGAAHYLVARGADVNGLAYETTPLIRAAWRGHTEMVNWLLDNGASIDATGWLGGHVKGGTALHIAANGGNLAMAKQLVMRGADLTIRDELYGGQPDGWADHHKHLEVRDFLRQIREAREAGNSDR